MNYVQGITLSKTEHATKPYLVNVAASIFGKQIRRRFKTKNQALAVVQQYENKVRENERVPLSREVHMVVQNYQADFTAEEFREILEDARVRYKDVKGTIKNMGDRYLTSKKRALDLGAVTPKFYNHSKTRANHAAEFFGSKAARDISQVDIEDYIIWMRNDKKYMPRTIKNHMSVLSAIFNHNINAGFLSRNPTKGVTLPPKKTNVGILRPDELQKLLINSDHYYQAYVMLGAFGGLRSSEIPLVSWEDVDMDEGQFYVPGRKNVCAERWVTMTPPLKDYFKKMFDLDNPPKGLIMAGLKETAIRRKRAKAKKKSGIQVPVNALRHSYASHHLVHYGDPMVTANEMGHVTPQITFAAYRRAVKKTTAAIYWNVRIDKPLPQEPTQRQHRESLMAA